MAEDIDRLATLEAGTVSVVTLDYDGVDEIQVITDGAEEVFYRLGYIDAAPTDPAVGDVTSSATKWLPASPSTQNHRRAGGKRRTVVKLVSEGTPRICVQPVQ